MARARCAERSPLHPQPSATLASCRACSTPPLTAADRPRARAGQAVGRPMSDPEDMDEEPPAQEADSAAGARVPRPSPSRGARHPPDPRPSPLRTLTARAPSASPRSQGRQPGYRRAAVQVFVVGAAAESCAWQERRQLCARHAHSSTREPRSLPLTLPSTHAAFFIARLITCCTCRLRTEVP